MSNVRPQYHLRTVGDDQLAWNVQKLIRLSNHLDVRPIRIADIQELDQNYWCTDTSATPRAIAEHARLIYGASLEYPIILDSTGRLMDGMHRVCRALLEEQAFISAVQFETDPEPDFRNVLPQDLPYD